MKRHSAESIIKTYRAMVAERGGTPIGARVFERESGIPKYHWQGGDWRSWSAFQQAAGFSPNDPSQRIPDDLLLQSFAVLTQKLGFPPTEADLHLQRKQDPSAPGKMAFRRWGNRDALLEAVAAYCEGKPDFTGVLDLLGQSTTSRVNQRLGALRVNGFVYLLRSGKNYKVGRSNAVGRRLHELAIQLPQRPDTVHVIETDDPEGIEQYWHRRFADKRQGGEWFTLTVEDVQAFKKRRFQ